MRALMLPAQSNPYQGLLAAALGEAGVEVVMADGPARFPVLPLLTAWLRAGRPSVVHLHWAHRYLRPVLGMRRMPPRRTLLELRLLKRAGVRLVWTVHNVGGHEGTRDREEQAAHRAIVETSDAVICHCEAARQLTIEAYELPPALHDRLHVVPHGDYAGVYPDTMDRETARAALGAGPADRVFLFLGQIRPYKGVEDLIDAFRALDRPDTRLVIAGRTSGVGMNRRLTDRMGGDPRILFVPGLVPDEMMQVYLRGADAAALPYRDVLTSGSAILALTFGLPVVAPGIGCLPETLEGCSVLYDPATPDGLRDALDRALASDLGALGERATAMARSLDWQTIARRTAELYRG
ncbi:MAG: glycosyltransferase [Chloroflexi bacterium]|nr:glycosyltransferase [Chloroflexota bacterium]